MNLNKVYLIGRLVADPEFRTTPTGQEVATLRIATNRIWNDSSTGQRNETTEYHNVVTWGKLAKIAGQFLTKGRLVMVEGRLQTRSWEGQDGVRRYRTEIIAENIQLGPKPKPEEMTATGQTAVNKINQEEIPIVKEEEEFPLEFEGNDPKQIKDSEESSEESEEVDLKDIPF